MGSESRLWWVGDACCTRTTGGSGSGLVGLVLAPEVTASETGEGIEDSVVVGVRAEDEGGNAPSRR